jgi:opacity protein-like surface antigen
MKKMGKVLLAVMMVCCCATFSLAKEGDKSVEAGFAIANKANKDDKVPFGGSGGFGYEILQSLQVRADIAYLQKSSGDVSTYRLPIDLGLRYLHQASEKVTLIGQGGLEFSMNKDDNQIGLSLGGGVEYAVSPQAGIISTLVFHFVPGGYVSWNTGVAFHFE